MSRMTMVFLLAATGCSEWELHSQVEPPPVPVPDILVDPPALTFGELASADEEVQTFTVENVGGANLNVADVVIASGASFTVLGPEATFELQPGEVREVDVAFTPLAADENFGRVLVLSDDPDTPEAPVDLLGYGAVPELDISPDHHDFGEAFIPCGDDVEVELRNVGSEALVIDEIAYTSGGALVLDDPNQLPITLEPDEATWVTVAFTAATDGADTGELAVTSNDPRGVVTATQTGEGAYVAEGDASYDVPDVAPVDIMFLVDDSCSMDNDQVRLANSFGDFIAQVNSVTTDWQIGVVSRDNGCFNNGILTESTPGYEALFADAATVGGGGMYTEKLLELAEISLSHTDPTGCNAGFLRPDALLHVITVSDEPEQSNTSAASWVSAYDSYKGGNPDLVKVSVVADLYTACYDTIYQSGPAGYVDAADLTGGMKLDICTEWGVHATELADASLVQVNTVELSDTPDESTIEVLVDGVTTTEWHYDAATNSVVLDGDLSGGEEVEITYDVLAEC